LSGIVGIFHRDGAPVQAEQLQPLLDALPHFGPGEKTIWLGESFGLGSAPVQPRTDTSALPRTSDTSIEHLQIAADVRLDARAELVSALTASGAQVSAATTDDAQLLLHAYARWGPACVGKLRGDFSFAIWNAKNFSLFCARDHFGIKPFYYALFDGIFVFSNVQNAVRRHPRVSGALNDSAVADFLLFGLNTDNATTTFADIQRLPPAHTLFVGRGSATVNRYWEVPTAGRIRYTSASDYIENFLAVWQPAVADRLDSSATGVLLSGGLDSAAVVATAHGQLKSSCPDNLRAFTITNENFPGDRDPQFASLLAAALGIPFEPISGDIAPFAHWADAQPISPEPVDDPLFAGQPLSFQKISTECRVLLSGEGADNLMHFEMLPYTADLFRRKNWSRLVADVSRFAWHRPFPWLGLRARVAQLMGRGEQSSPQFPKWISPDFAQRLNLHDRWRFGQTLPIPPHRHPIHPKAHASLYLPQWTRMFELESPGVTNCAVEVRYPFLDLRVVEYLLAIPPYPWFYEKNLLRQAMAGRVLDSVRLRPKTPFSGDPLLLQLQRYGSIGVNDVKREFPHLPSRDAASRGVTLSPEAEVGRYIINSLLLPLHANMSSEQVNQMARPIAFNFWLQSVRKTGYN
jgi:asparagine synthase (glutamine-hydrolysing)